MFDSLIALPLSIAALGAGLMAGVYFAFSAFIMRAFDRLGAVDAVESPARRVLANHRRD